MQITYSGTSESTPQQIAPGLLLDLPGKAHCSEVKLGGDSYDVTLLLDWSEGGVKPVAITVQAPAGSPPITSTTLRAVTVTELTRKALREALLKAVDRGEVSYGPGGSFHADYSERAVRLNAEEVERIRAQGPTDESLRVAGTIYNMAVPLGLQPAKEVEEILGLPRTTASKWVRRAREKGFIQSGGEG